MTTPHSTPIIEHMNYHNQLQELGIDSREEAEELERELGLRFRDFTHDDRKTWKLQNAYLDRFAKTRATTISARDAGVTVYTVQSWESDDELDFNRRLEVSNLEFCDQLESMALERAREPSAPAALLAAILRCHMPDKYSAKGQTRDTSKADEILRRLRHDAHREKAEGYPTLRAISRHELQPPTDGRLSRPLLLNHHTLSDEESVLGY